MKHPITGAEVNQISRGDGADALITVSKYAVGKALETLHDLKNQLDEFDRILGLRQPSSPAPGAPRSGPYRYKDQTVRGTPEHSAKMTKSAHSYWANKTPEERSAEMKHRARVAAGLEPSKRAGLKPGAKRKSTAGLKRGTPEFKAVDAYNKRLITAEKRAGLGRKFSGLSPAQIRWENSSPYQRKKWQKAMKAGRERAAAGSRVDQLLNGAEVTQ